MSTLSVAADERHRAPATRAAAAMKVLYLNTSGVIGGAERGLLDMMAGLRTARPDWRLSLIAGDDGPLLSRAREIGVDATVLPIPKSLAMAGDAGAGGPAGSQVGRLMLAASIANTAFATQRYARAMTHAIQAAAPDLIHTNGFKMHVIGAQAAGRKIPIVWHIHDYVGSRPVMARLMRFFARRCNFAIANSHSVQADVEAICRDRFQATTLYYAVDLDYFHPTGPALDLDAAAGLPPAPRDVVRVGLVGTLARWKGHDVFLRAIADLPSGLPVRGYVVGGPIYSTRGSQWSLQELRAMAERLGIAGRIGFTGFVQDVAPAIRALDIVVHASTEREPFGLAIAEAMACARPVIASGAGGAAEIFDAATGVLTHRPGESSELAERIGHLVRDPDERARRGRVGRRAAERLFTRSRQAAELIAIYEQVRGGAI